MSRVRRLWIALGVVGVAILVAPGCGSTTSPAPIVPDADASVEASSPPDPSAEGAGAADGSAGAVDAGADAGDAGRAGECASLNGKYDKTCGSAADCLMVSVGCYCGAQPIIGVARSAQPAAQGCESAAEMHCTLGCAQAPGHVGEDGKNDEGTGKNLEVRCDDNKCHTALEPEPRRGGHLRR